MAGGSVSRATRDAAFAEGSGQLRASQGLWPEGLEQMDIPCKLAHSSRTGAELGPVSLGAVFLPHRQ